MRTEEKERIRRLLCQLGNEIRDFVLDQRRAKSLEELASVSAISAADTIYAIDKFSERALLEWFGNNWPEDLPVEVVAEGLEDRGPVVFPQAVQLADTRFKVIIDPIDGTRELMFDKRSAWVIAGVAPQRFSENRTSGIEVAVMTELPPTKQRLADQISGVRGCGRDGLAATRLDLDKATRSPFPIAPSQAADLEHAVAAFVKVFPEGKELTARFETDLWKQLDLFAAHRSPVIFDDQYISTGGQMYELLVGHYRFYGDIRPQVLQSLGLGRSLTCHPYDIAGALLLQEAGCVFESPCGQVVDAPMDTVSPVSWVAYANQELAGLMRPALNGLMQKYFG